MSVYLTVLSKILCIVVVVGWDFFRVVFVGLGGLGLLIVFIRGSGVCVLVQRIF